MKPSTRQKLVYTVAAIVFVAFLFLPQSLEDATLITGLSALTAGFVMLMAAVKLVNVVDEKEEQ